MIIEALCDKFFAIFCAWLDTWPVMSWDIPTGAIDSFLTFLDIAAYFFPMNTVAAILGLVIIEESVKISIAGLKLIWKFIPFIGA